MDFTVSVLLGTFILSIAALFVFIWYLSNGLFGDGLQAATEIFVPNELGRVEDRKTTLQCVLHGKSTEGWLWRGCIGCRTGLRMGVSGQPAEPQT